MTLRASPASAAVSADNSNIVAPIQTSFDTSVTEVNRAFSKIGSPQDNNAIPQDVTFGKILKVDRVSQSPLSRFKSGQQSPLKGDVRDARSVAKTEFLHKDPAGVNVYYSPESNGVSYLSDGMLSSVVTFKHYTSTRHDRFDLQADPMAVFNNGPVAVYGSKNYDYTIKLNPDYLEKLGVPNFKGFRLRDFYNVHLATEGDKSLLTLNPERPISQSLLGFSDLAGTVKKPRNTAQYQGFQDYRYAPKLRAGTDLAAYAQEKNTPPPRAEAVAKAKAPQTDTSTFLFVKHLQGLNARDFADGKGKPLTAKGVAFASPYNVITVPDTVSTKDVSGIAGVWSEQGRRDLWQALIGRVDGEGSAAAELQEVSSPRFEMSGGVAEGGGGIQK
jgi:hypothetical protein